MADVTDADADEALTDDKLVGMADIIMGAMVSGNNVDNVIGILPLCAEAGLTSILPPKSSPSRVDIVMV